MLEIQRSFSAIKELFKITPPTYYPIGEQSPEMQSIYSSRNEYREIAEAAPLIPIYPDIPLIDGPPPHQATDQKEVTEGKEPAEITLYKGLQPSAFRYYFKDGGIRPRQTDKSNPWITTDLTRALEHANVAEKRTCLAVIDASVLQRGNLKVSRDVTSLLSGNFADYYGDETIGWSDVKGLFVTRTVINDIYHYFQQVQPDDLEWGYFASKVSVVPPNDERYLNRSIRQLR